MRTRFFLSLSCLVLLSFACVVVVGQEPEAPWASRMAEILAAEELGRADGPQRMTLDNIPPPRFGTIQGSEAQKIQGNLSTLMNMVKKSKMGGSLHFLIQFQLTDELHLTVDQVNKLNNIGTIELTQIQADVAPQFVQSRRSAASPDPSAAAMELPPDQFNEYMRSVFQTYADKMQESDKQVSDILTSPQNQRFKQLQFQYYLLLQTDLRRALSIFDRNVDERRADEIEAVLERTHRLTVIATDVAAQFLRRDAVREVLGESEFQAIAGNDYNFGFPAEWLEVVQFEPTESRPNLNSRRKK